MTGKRRPTLKSLTREEAKIQRRIARQLYEILCSPERLRALIDAAKAGDPAAEAAVCVLEGALLLREAREEG